MNAVHPYVKEIAALRDQIELLREHNRQLQAELAPADILLPPDWRLTPREDQILRSLVKAPGGFLSRESIYNRLYDADSDVEIKIIDVLICKLRHKLKPQNVTIENIWGRGYRLPPAAREIIRAAAAEA